MKMASDRICEPRALDRSPKAKGTKDSDPKAMDGRSTEEARTFPKERVSDRICEPRASHALVATRTTSDLVY